LPLSAVLLFAKLHNIYIVLLIVTTFGWGTIVLSMIISKSFKKDKQGLKGILFGQVGLGVIVGTVLYFHPSVTVRTDWKIGCV
jgi:phospho-N-acetylmuramoyl-pentapeptide-transferase